MKAIAKKDFQSNFHSVTGWLFIAVFWAFLSFFVSNYNFLSLSSDITSAVSTVEIIFLILMPILCMRSFSEEQRQRTDQILFTAPVSVGQVVFQKFLALAEIYTIPVLMTCVYPLILSAFGNVSFGSDYIAILGMWLYGLACIAICVFASSLTENPIIAAVLSFLFLFVMYLIPTIKNMVSSNTVLTKFLSAINVRGQFENFLSGSLNITAIIYMATVIFLFLFLTTQIIQKRRYSISKKTISFGAYSSVMIVVVLAITVVVNLAATKLPDSVQNIDVTSSRLYSLTDDTKKIVSGLTDDVNIYVLDTESASDKTLNKTLKSYEALSGHIKVSYVNPAEDPTFIQKYTDDSSNVYMNSLIVTCGDKSKIVNFSDIYETSMDYTTYSQKTTGYDGEGQITSAISYVTGDTNPVIYTLTGHNETALSATFKDSVSKMNIDVKDLDFMQNDNVPDDAQAVIINAPTSDLSSDDLKKLENYFDKGGNVIAVTNYEATGDMTNYKSLLSYFGITLNDGVVLDSDSSRYYQYPSYLLPNVQSDDITSGITNGYVIVPFSQELTYDSSNTQVAYTPLLETSESAYVHSSVKNASDMEQTDSDQLAARIVGLKAVKTIRSSGGSTTDTNSSSGSNSVSSSSSASSATSSSSSTAENISASSSASESVTSTSSTADSNTATVTSTAVVYTSPFIFNDNANQMVSGSNLSLFSGSIGAVTSDKTTISIPSKSLDNTTITMATRTAVILTILFVILIPVALLVCGIAIWVIRRKR
ncbi:MAG: Gldg family protein [Bilifractor sp.]|nr:Gldg family protein [Lachnospiraceae bacterium]MDY2837380.1 Gldg family protein [Bilifractor sp.]